MDENKDISEKDTEPVEKEEMSDAAKQATNASKKQKKRILIVLAAMLAFVALYFGVSALVSYFEEREEDTKVKPNTIIFYEADYDYDIMEDSEYLGLDRQIYFSEMGVTISVPDDQMSMQDPAFRLLAKMVECIQYGNSDGYNVLFSDNYYSAEGNEREDAFTMQQIYDIKLTKESMSTQTTEEGRTYTQYEYIVEYKIHKNNGTFRTDIGSDASRKQYFVISDIQRGSNDTGFLIDRILGYKEE